MYMIGFRIMTRPKTAASKIEQSLTDYKYFEQINDMQITPNFAL